MSFIIQYLNPKGVWDSIGVCDSRIEAVQRAVSHLPEHIEWRVVDINSLEAKETVRDD
jgi:hypothetical protein